MLLTLQRLDVDVYLNGDLALNDFQFRTATPYIDVPARNPDHHFHCTIHFC